MKFSYRRKELGDNALKELFGVDYEDIDFSIHALQRMKERGVSFDSVMEALLRPLRVKKKNNDRDCRLWIFTLNKKRVVLNLANNKVVTVMRIKKIRNEVGKKNEGLDGTKKFKDNFSKQLSRRRLQKNSRNSRKNRRDKEAITRAS